jgi:glycosyltransferase involved in cell wall biosynthesis
MIPRHQAPGVLLIVENHPVPSDRRVWAEAQTLYEAGYRVSVICPRGRKMDRDAYECKDGVHIYRFAMPFDGPQRWNFFLEYTWAFLVCFGLSLRVWMERGFDVVHVGNPPDIFFPLAWFYRLFGKKFIFDQHDLSPETYLSKFESGGKGLLYKLLLRSESLSYRASDVVIATNESYRDVMLARGRLPEERIFIVRNGPSPRIFQPREPKLELKDGYRYLVSFVGIMGNQDGVDYLLRAAHHIIHDLWREDILFVIIGTGDAWDDLQALHAELQLGAHVRFTGRIPDDPMLDYLSTSDVCASPDPFNPLNDISTMNKMMEFMAMGKPVVSFELKEARYSAQDAAVYIGNNDWCAFGQAIVDLLADPARRHQMGQAGRRRIRDVLSWEVSSRHLLSAYRKVLGNAALPDESAT